MERLNIWALLYRDIEKFFHFRCIKPVILTYDRCYSEYSNRIRMHFRIRPRLRHFCFHRLIKYFTTSIDSFRAILVTIYRRRQMKFHRKRPLIRLPPPLIYVPGSGLSRPIHKRHHLYDAPRTDTELLKCLPNCNKKTTVSNVIR